MVVTPEDPRCDPSPANHLVLVFIYFEHSVVERVSPPDEQMR